MFFQLPMCDIFSPEPVVCGRVQANLNSVTALDVCQCFDTEKELSVKPCSKDYDSADGHTVTTGTGEQLKVPEPYEL